MSLQSFAEMNEQQFQNIIDHYVDRAAAGQMDAPADVFFDLLANRLTQNVDETVNLTVEVGNNDLTLHADREFADIIIRGNEIIVGRHRFVLQFSGQHDPAFATVG